MVHAMLGPSQIIGSVVLAVMGIVFHILNQMPFKMPIRRRIDRLWRKISWMFPRSEEPPRHGVVYFLFGIPFGLFILGVEMTGNCTVAEWAFVATEISAVITIWIFFVILTPFARKFWTLVVAIALGLGLFYFYGYLCPTVTINPSKVIFGSISKSDLSETRRFRIQNKVDNDLYSVTFKLVIKSSSVKLSDFKFDVPKSSLKPIEENTAIGRKFGDIGGVDCTDSKNRPVFVRFISHLSPRESREVTLTYINPHAESLPPSATLPPHLNLPNYSDGIIVDAKVTNFSDDSEIWLSRPGFQAGSLIYIDETMKCTAMGFVVLSGD